MVKIEISNPYTSVKMEGEIVSVNKDKSTCKALVTSTGQFYNFYIRPDGSLHGQGHICHLTAEVLPS